MAIWGSLNTSRMAMDAHSYQLETLGNNIANVNTVAYKGIDTLYQSMENPSKPRLNFFGVKTFDRRHVDVQGLLAATGRNLDLAVDGKGFFITNTKSDGSGETYYTRDGSFRTKPVGDGGVQNHLVGPTGDYVMGWEASPDGKNFSGGMSAVNLARFRFSDGLPTTKMALKGNISPANGASFDPVRETISVIRPTGGNTTASEPLVLKFTPSQSLNIWKLEVEGAKSAVADPSMITFAGDGSLLDPKSVKIDIVWKDNVSQTVSIDLSAVTQYKSPNKKIDLSAISNDGQLAGELRDVRVDKNGVVTGFYSNNATRPIAKLPLALFPSENNLEACNGNRFRATSEAGTPQILDLQTSNDLARIVGGSLERGNVVLEDQFSKMIITQRAYSSAASVFRTSDEMLLEVKNLKS